MIRLPDPVRAGGKLDAHDMDRLVAELTRILETQRVELQELRRRTSIETDLTRAPTRIGAIAVAGGFAYIAIGLTPADWKQVS